MSLAKVGRAMPQHVHLMPRGARSRRLCGATSGGFIRLSEERYLRQFLSRGGGLCPECARIADVNGVPLRATGGAR